MKSTLSKNDYKWHHEVTHFPELMFEGYVGYGNKHRNFCSYMWFFLWKLLIVIPVVVAIIGILLGYYFAGWFELLFAPVPSFRFFAGNNLVWIAMNTLVVLVIFMAVPYSKFIEKYSENRKSKPDGLLLTWYKAKKDKYCRRMYY